MSVTLKMSDFITYKDLVTALDLGGHGYVAIIDDEDRLIGFVTDGDIRRCILNNTLTIEDMINYNPIFCSFELSKDAIVAQLKLTHLRHMPIVDKESRLVDVVSIDDNSFIIRENTVVIMAGGLGSRLGALTKQTPKPMLKLGNKPIIQHIIEQFRNEGYINFIISTNYKKEVIEDYFHDGSDFGVNIKYVNETIRLGTAGALSLIQAGIKKPFFVTNADVMTKIDYCQLMADHENSLAKATMCVRPHTQTIPFGVIESNSQGDIVDIKEKPTYSFDINAGVYVLDPSVLSIIPEQEFYDMPTLFKDICASGSVTKTYPIEGYWIDIGNPDDYEAAQRNMDKLLEAEKL